MKQNTLDLHTLTVKHVMEQSSYYYNASNTYEREIARDH